MYWWANVCEIAPLPRKSAKSRPYQNFRTSATFLSLKYVINPCKIAVISLLYSVYYELYFSILIVLINPFFVEFRVKIILDGSYLLLISISCQSLSLSNLYFLLIFTSCQPPSLANLHFFLIFIAS